MGMNATATKSYMHLHTEDRNHNSNMYAIRRVALVLNINEIWNVVYLFLLDMLNELSDDKARLVLDKAPEKYGSARHSNDIEEHDIGKQKAEKKKRVSFCQMVGPENYDLYARNS